MSAIFRKVAWFTRVAANCGKVSAIIPHEELFGSYAMIRNYPVRHDAGIQKSVVESQKFIVRRRSLELGFEIYILCFVKNQKAVVTYYLR